MKILKYFIFPVLIFISSCTVAFLFEGVYSDFIYCLYIFLSSQRISFKIQKLDLHFASSLFCYSFAITTTVLYYVFLKHNFKQFSLKLLIFLFLSVATTLLICYIDSLLKLAECTTCKDGKRILKYYEVKTDLTFVFSMFFGILPIIFSEIKQYGNRIDR